MVDPESTDFEMVQIYLAKIDSIESSHTLKVKIKDSVSGIKIKKAISRVVGNYKVDVIGTRMDKEVEIFQLMENGKSAWLWVYYVDGHPIVDEKKTGSWWLDSKGDITIRIQGKSGTIEEVFSNIDGKLMETTRKIRSLVKTQESF